MLGPHVGWGVLCAVAACFCGTLSKVVWRLSHKTEQAGGGAPNEALTYGSADSAGTPAEDAGRRVPKRGGVAADRACRIWLGGALLIVPNVLCDVVAFSFAPQSVVASIAGLSTVFNLLMAPMILGEQWSKMDVLGAVLVISGCVGVALTVSAQPHPDYEFVQMLGMFGSARFLTFACAGACTAQCFACPPAPPLIANSLPRPQPARSYRGRCWCFSRGLGWRRRTRGRECRCRYCRSWPGGWSAGRSPGASSLFPSGCGCLCPFFPVHGHHHRRHHRQRD